MGAEAEIALSEAVEFVVDNRGRTAPTEESGIPLIATNCISNGNLYPVHERPRYVSDETYRTWFRSHPEPGDIILTNKGSQNGAVCLVPDPVNFCIAQDMVALRADSSKIDPLYLFASLRSSLVQRRMKNLNVDSVIPHFKKTDFNKLFIPCPSKHDQKYIGQIYYTFSRKIELNRQMNDTLESMAQALFKSWFVDFDPVIDNALEAGNPIPDSMQARAEVRKALGDQRKPLPDHIQSQFPNSFVMTEETGWVPEGWKIQKLHTLCQVINGRAYKNTEFKDSGTPIIRIQNLSGGGKTVYSDLELHPDKYAEKEDFIYAWSASFGPYIWRRQKSIYHYHIWKMEVNEAIVSRYFMYLTMGRKTEAMKNTGTGSIFTHLTKKIMESQHVLIANDSINKEMGSRLEILFHKITALEEESNTLSALRDTLLPKLLSGQLRIPDTEKLVANVL
jgi:type I restriction enzyme S subunit